MNLVSINNGQEYTLTEGSEFMVQLTNVPAIDKNGPNIVLGFIKIISSSGVKFSANEALASTQHAWVTNDSVPISFVNSGVPGASLHVQGSVGDKIVITV